MSAVRSSLTRRSSARARSVSQWTARSRIGIEQVSPSFPFTRVIAQPSQPTRKNSKGVQQYAPAGGSVWNTPAVDPRRGAIYFGTGDATTFPPAPTADSVMALDMKTGAVRWSYAVQHGDSYLVGCQDPGQRTDNCPDVQGPDWDIPASVILKRLRNGRRVIVVGTKPGDILALDPDRQGALVWRMNIRGGPPMVHTLAAIDMALWDITGKLWKVPVYRLLGGPCRDRIRVYHTAKAIKVPNPGYFEHCGNPADIDRIVEAVRAARQRVGADGTVMFDAHSAVPPATLIQVAAAIQPYDVLFIEEPAVPGGTAMGML